MWVPRKSEDRFLLPHVLMIARWQSPTSTTTCDPTSRCSAYLVRGLIISHWKFFLTVYVLVATFSRLTRHLRFVTTNSSLPHNPRIQHIRSYPQEVNLLSILPSPMGIWAFHNLLCHTARGIHFTLHLIYFQIPLAMLFPRLLSPNLHWNRLFILAFLVASSPGPLEKFGSAR